MKQFDVFVADDGGLFCVLQSDLLDTLGTVMVAPLSEVSTPMTRLTPAVEIDSSRYLLDVPLQIPIRSTPLQHRSPLASLDPYRDEILDALNLMYWGI